jgi:hypothetical protein
LLANPPAYMAGAKTVSECEFLVWDHGTIRRLAKAYPQLTENGLRLALHYLNVYMNRHASIVTKSAEFKTRRSTAASRHRSGEGAAVGSGNRHHHKQLSSLSDISRLSRGSQNTALFSSVEFILSSLRQRNDSF